MKKGVLVFKGDAGRPDNNLAKCLIKGVETNEKLTALATALEAHTDCKVVSRSFNEVTDLAVAAPGANANVDKKGIITMKDPSTGNIVKIEIPAPKAADYTLVGQGERYTSEALSSIVSAVNTATGKTYIGLSGKVIGRP